MVVQNNVCMVKNYILKTQNLYKIVIPFAMSS